jgi:two-component system chemotaxis response regulator CheB
VLPQILDRRTALAVEAATDGDPLAPGQVLVAPPGSHTLIAPNGTVALIPAGGRPPCRPSADLLLTTLATAAGSRAVAVVLSGYGNDAATGASAIHRFGGTVIVASLETSTAPSMPQATIGRDHATDHVVPLEEIAALLLALTTAPRLEYHTGDESRVNGLQLAGRAPGLGSSRSRPTRLGHDDRVSLAN